MMKDEFRAALGITVLTFAGQGVLFAAQIVSASIFGAGADMDAFIAANTLPQFVISVLIGSVGFVFIPFFVNHKMHGDTTGAYNLALSLFNNCILVLGIVTLAGAFLARPLLELTTPGLSDEVLNKAVQIARINWPTIIATGAFALLASIYQAEGRFKWQAAAPFLGASVNLLLLIILSRHLGIIGLAIATTSGVLVQALLLLPILSKAGPYRFRLGWGNRELIEIVRLIVPLVLVAVITKFTPLVDRYLGSSLPEGSISHLNYAFKVTTILSLLISTGTSTVIFPKMAADVSGKDRVALRSTLSRGLRFMWLVLAPVIAIGIVLSLPLIITVFNRGEFILADAVAVSYLFKIYSIALFAMSLGNITGKGFYVLKRTNTLAIFGAIEALAYVVYTFLLTRWLGVTGIALGFAIYYNISLLWQLLWLNYQTGSLPLRAIKSSFTYILIAACVGGVCAYLTSVMISLPFLKLVVGGVGGLLAYGFALELMKCREWTQLKELIVFR